MTNKQFKRMTALLSAGVLTTSMLAVPMTVKADEEPVTINFSF